LNNVEKWSDIPKNPAAFSAVGIASVSVDVLQQCAKKVQPMMHGFCTSTENQPNNF